MLVSIRALAALISNMRHLLTLIFCCTNLRALWLRHSGSVQVFLLLACFTSLVVLFASWDLWIASADLVCQVLSAAQSPQVSFCNWVCIQLVWSQLSVESTLSLVLVWFVWEATRPFLFTVRAQCLWVLGPSGEACRLPDLRSRVLWFEIHSLSLLRCGK